MNASKTRNRLLAVAVAAAILDLATKAWVFSAIPARSHRVVLGNLLWLEPTRNPHGPWSLGRDIELPIWVLALFSLVAIVLIGRLFWQPDGDRVKGLGLALILGGAAGNLWDRVATVLDPDFIGVRDFILVRGVWFLPRRGLWRVWDWEWGASFPAFNVADACITVGVVLVAWRILFEKRPAAAPEPAKPAEAQS